MFGLRLLPSASYIFRLSLKMPFLCKGVGESSFQPIQRTYKSEKTCVIFHGQKQKKGRGEEEEKYSHSSITVLFLFYECNL